jgi:SSS family solute:Na+ symporter
VGAWLAAVLVIPRVKPLGDRLGLLSYPDVLRHRFGENVALAAALVSGLGYLGFTAGQVLAGAKLASATIFTEPALGLDPLQFSLLMIAVVTIAYTVLGGLKAVIYTDSVQWAVLLVGLIAVAIPVALWGELGGIAELRRVLPPSHFSLSNVTSVQLVNWAVTIIPIWFIGMTLYQRIFACRDVKTARRAWYLAGLLEWPLMAFMGVFLGMCARALFPDVEPEMGLPLLVSQALPVGVAGLLSAAYFSAIMSTADSCLMASSGNLVGDLLQRRVGRHWSDRRALRVSQLVTLVVGVLALLLAARFTRVLDIILLTYSFMVSGLLAPTLGALYWRRASATGAGAAIVVGGGLTLLLESGALSLPVALAEVGLASTAYGLAASAVTLGVVSVVRPDAAPADDIGG